MSISAFDIRRATLEDNPADDVQELSYNFKAAQDLGQLASMTSLRRLNVAFNELSHIRSIHSLKHLQHFNVSHNQLSSLDPITALTCLTSLNAGCNRICTTSALEALPQLRVLGLHGNAISKPSAVLLLAKLTSLQHLTLANNPVCKQQNWQQATIAAVPGLQALDSMIISSEVRAAAQPHADVWHQAVMAGDADLASSSDTISSSNSSGAGGLQAGSRRAGCSTAGRLGSQGVGDGGGPSSPGIKDAAALLPCISLPPLKPSSLVNNRAERDQGQQPSLYGYTRAKPVTAIHQQRYAGSSLAAAAIVVRSDGSAALQWPDGSMAASLDANGSDAVAGSCSSSRIGCSYRLLAMYRSVMGVAASFDSNGGFVQWPNGSLMLVWNRKDGVGKCYAADGSTTHSFNSRRKPLVLKEDVTAKLDQHFSIKFAAKTCELQLHFTCDGCQVGLSLLHGAMLPDGCQTGAAGQEAKSAGQAHAVDAGNGGAAAAAAAMAQAAAGDTLALLARARALMAADLSDVAGSSSGSAPIGVATPVPAAAAPPPPPPPAAVTNTAGGDDTQDLLARARALMAASHGDLMQ